MSFQPNDAQTHRYIEQGTNAENVYSYTHNNQSYSVKWSPISYNLAKIAFYNALLSVTEEHREWLGSKKERRIERSLVRPPNEVILLFNFQHAVHSIYYAIRRYYHNITLHEIEDLNFDIELLHDEIAIASGLIDGQEAVQSFPADAPTQDAEN